MSVQMSQRPPRLPNNTQRLSVVGRTGSGKTQAALWHLSRRNFDLYPWMIYDFKGDDHIAKIERAEVVDTDFVPSKKHKGLFVVRPLPHETEEVEKQMWKLWERGNVGVFVDEGYMIDNPAFDAILTQGRSLKIPAITLSQRPVWMSRFVFSESDFIQVFGLNDIRDEKTVAQFVRGVDFSSPLNDYHSHYFDVGRRSLYRFAPVPQEDEILDSINSRLASKRRFL